MLFLPFINFAQSLTEESVSSFVIESADIYQSANNYYLNAAIDYDIHPEAHEILAKGLPIHIVFELELYKVRRYWLDKTLLEKEFSYILQHDPITNQYELTRVDTDFTLSYETVQAAIASLRYLTNLFVVETENIAEGDETFAQLRMSLDIRNFPEPMQYLSQYWGDWIIATEWYQWSMKDSRELNFKAVAKELKDIQDNNDVAGVVSDEVVAEEAGKEETVSTESTSEDTDESK